MRRSISARRNADVSTRQRYAGGTVIVVSVAPDPRRGWARIGGASASELQGGQARQGLLRNPPRGGPDITGVNKRGVEWVYAVVVFLFRPAGILAVGGCRWAGGSWVRTLYIAALYAVAGV